MLTGRFHEGPDSMIHTREGLVRFIDDMNALAESLNLPNAVKRRAGSIVRDAATMRFCRVISRPIIAAAVLYVACREHDEPVTLRELADATATDPRDVGRCYATVLERMHIARPALDDGQYVHHLSLSRPLPAEAYKMSEDIIRRAAQSGLEGRNPMTLAAAALYIACCNMGERITQAEVSNAAGIGEESVRECCKAIRSSEERVAHWGLAPETWEMPH